MTLKEKMKELDRHGAQLARYVGVKRSTATRWINGQKPLKKYHAKIAEYLGVSEEEVAGYWEAEE
jgi:transcriptional regulator with XRE-family HTH domain